eukprot:Nk52_evm1s225 gene=Nk52_evmTU1s225
MGDPALTLESEEPKFLTAMPEVMPPVRKQFAYSVFQDCPVLCDQDAECGLVIYEDSAMMCSLYAAKDLDVMSTTYKSVPHQQVAAYFRWERIKDEYLLPLINEVSTDRTSAVCSPDCTNNIMARGEGETFLQAAKAKSEHAMKVSAQLNSPFLLDAWNNGEVTQLLTYIDQIGSTILGFNRPYAPTTLPPINAQKVAENLQNMKQDMISVSNKIDSITHSMQMQELEHDVLGVMKAQTKVAFDKGSFDFKFLVGQHRRFNDRLPGVFSSMTKVFDDIKGEMTQLRIEAVLVQNLNVVFQTAKAVASTAGLANPFLAGKSQADCMENWHQVLTSVASLAMTSAAVDDAVKAADKMKGILSGATKNMKAVIASANSVQTFVDSFENNGFTAKLNDTFSRSIIKTFEDYNAPVNGPDFIGTMTTLKTSYSRMIADISEKAADPINAGLAQHFSTKVQAAFEQMDFFMNVANSMSESMVKNSINIVSQYILVSGNDAVIDNIDGMMEKTTSNELKFIAAKGFAVLQLDILIEMFTSDLLQLCNLKEYYTGGERNSYCDAIRLRRQVLTVDGAFMALQVINADMNAPSFSGSSCGYFPVATNVDEDGPDAVKNTISIDNLRQLGSTSFSWPVNTTWLRKYGWNDIAIDIENGRNVFVSSIQIPIPYYSFKDYQSCGPSLMVNVRTQADFLVLSPSSGKTVAYQPSGFSQLTYEFAYKTEYSGPCPSESKVHPDYMAPCGGSYSLGTNIRLPDICIGRDGGVEMYDVLDSGPPLPALFTPFDVAVIRSDQCVEYPRLATTRKDGDDKNATFPLNDMWVPVCIDYVSKGDMNTNTRGGGNASLANEKCVVCPEGSYQKSFLRDLATCVACPTGTYQPEKGRYACLECPPGTYQDKEGSVDCKKCKSVEACPLYASAHPFGS